MRLSAEGSVLATLQHLAQRVEVEPHDPLSYPPDVLADDGLALIDWLGLDDYDLGGYSLGGRIVLRMLVRGARPTRAIVAGQGLDAINRATSRNGQYRRVLTALVNRDTIEPGSPDEETAHWITQSGGDPQALLHILDTLVATPDAALCQVATPTLVAIGDQDHGHASADALAATLPNARFTRVPGNHFTALTRPECQRPSCGPRWWPSKSPHPSGVVQVFLGRAPPRLRAWRMRNDSPSVTTTLL
jgi:pimeloyl-ACP methyl ester carboxylesterase